MVREVSLLVQDVASAGAVTGNKSLMLKIFPDIC
jgi:hypothetical protein